MIDVSPFFVQQLWRHLNPMKNTQRRAGRTSADAEIHLHDSRVDRFQRLIL